MDVSHQRYNLKAPYLKQRQYYTLSFFWRRSISRLSAKKRKQIFIWFKTIKGRKFIEIKLTSMIEVLALMLGFQKCFIVQLPIHTRTKCAMNLKSRRM